MDQLRHLMRGERTIAVEETLGVSVAVTVYHDEGAYA